MAEEPEFRLLVGLGNPGSEYVRTRHNVGFMIMDLLAAAGRIEFRAEREWNAEIASQEGVLLCKPLSFMNRSGGPVSRLSNYYKIEPRKILVVLDDAALPLGKIRLRRNGSAGGHNGLQSIIENLGTDEVARLRIGIGGSEPGEMTGHVLGKFAAEEIPALEESLRRAVEAIDCAQKAGAESAMNQYNQ